VVVPVVHHSLILQQLTFHSAATLNIGYHSWSICRHLTTETRLRCYASSCGICGRQSGTKKGVYFPSFWVRALSPVGIIPQMLHTHLQLNILVYYWEVGPDSSVGIAIRYRLESPGIESQLRRDFSHTSSPALGPSQPLVQWVPGLSRGAKRPGRRVDPPTSV
jgi:hypothetical protein